MKMTRIENDKPARTITPDELMRMGTLVPIDFQRARRLPNVEPDHSATNGRVLVALGILFVVIGVTGWVMLR